MGREGPQEPISTGAPGAYMDMCFETQGGCGHMSTGVSGREGPRGLYTDKCPRARGARGLITAGVPRREGPQELILASASECVMSS